MFFFLFSDISSSDESYFYRALRVFNVFCFVSLVTLVGILAMAGAILHAFRVFFRFSFLIISISITAQTGAIS